MYSAASSMVYSMSEDATKLNHNIETKTGETGERQKKNQNYANCFASGGSLTHAHGPTIRFVVF